MSEGLSGKCLCGAVSYESSAAPAMLMKCHCRDCQYISGGEASAIIGVPKEGFKFSGAIKTYQKTGTSGKKVARKFCPECGTHIFSEVEVQPDMVFVKAGTMAAEIVNGLETAIVLWTDNAHPWSHIDEKAQSFGTQPG